MNGSLKESASKRDDVKKIGIFEYIFTSYEALSRNWEKSGVAAVFSRVQYSKAAAFVRRAVSRSAEHSVLLRLLNRFVSALPGVTLKAYGTFLFSLGFYSVLAFVIKAVSSTLVADIDALITAVVIMLVAFPLLLSKKTLAESVLESRVGSFIAFDVLGFRREVAALKRAVYRKSEAAMLSGMILGLLSFYIDIRYIVAAVVYIISGYLLITRTEGGVIVLFVLAPFMSYDAMTVYIAFLALGYIFKLMTGRRTFKLDIVDAVMLVFATVVILGGVVHYGNGSGIGDVASVRYILVYFVITNVIKNDVWREKCRHSVTVGGGFLALVFLIFRLFDVEAMLSYDFVSPTLQRMADRAITLFAETADITPYLVMLLPMMITRAVVRKEGGVSVSAVLSVVITVSAIVYTESRSLWLGAVMGIFIIMVARNFNYLWLPMTLAVAAPFVLYVAPPGLERFIMRILDLSGADTVARIRVRVNSARIFFDNVIGGIGVSDDVFSSLYASYDRFGEIASNSQCLPLGIAVRYGITGVLIFALLVFLLIMKAVTASKNSESRESSAAAASSVIGMTALLISSFTMDIFSDQKLFILFFMFAAFISAYTSPKPRGSRTSDDRMSNDNVTSRDGKTAAVDIDYR